MRKSLWPMALLFLAANFYSIDKAIVGVLAEPIKADLGIDDIRMGLLMGLAYAFLSGICGLWLGSLVDRSVRKRVLGWAIIVWSVSTALGGLAPDFASFFALRAVVGIGEAAVAPAAVSLIADMFPPEQRGRALSAYLIGASIGTALSSVIPGAIVAANLHLVLPGVGLIVPWRSAFLLFGLAAGVWTGNLSRAHRMVRGIRSGVVHVNTYGGADNTVPLGGHKQSGNGHDKSLHALDKYTDLKTAWIQL